MKNIFLIILLLFSTSCFCQKVISLEKTYILVEDTCLKIETTNRIYSDSLCRLNDKDKKLLYFSQFLKKDKDSNSYFLIFSLAYKKTDEEYVYEVFNKVLGLKR